MSREEMKKTLDNKARKGADLPIVGGIVNWGYKVGEGFMRFVRAPIKTKLYMTKEGLLRKGLIIIMILFAVYTAIMNSNFLSWGNITTIITYTALNLFMALGVAGIILLTGTDLSAGKITAFTAAIVAAFLQTKKSIFTNMGSVPWIVPLLVAIVIGAAIGFINGFFTAKFKLHSFIVTLSMQFVITSVVYLFFTLNGNSNLPLQNLDPSFLNLIKRGINIGGATIPWLVIYAIVAAFIVWLIWNKTKIGKNMYAVGCNPEAATVSGISVFWVIMTTFIMAGVLYGISGFMYAGWNSGANTQTALNQELYAIAGCVIGGVSFSGGVGRISGVILGVLLVQMINNALQLLGVDGNLIYLITGVIILLAVILDMRKYIVKR